MADFILIFFTAILILISAFVVLVILMQRPSANAGLGSALGGGAAESALGAQAGNILTKITIYGVVAFFVCAFSLYLGFMAMHHGEESSFGGLEDGLTEVVEEKPAVESPVAEATEADAAATAEAVSSEVAEATAEAAEKVEEAAAKVEAAVEEVKAEAEAK